MGRILWAKWYHSNLFYSKIDVAHRLAWNAAQIKKGKKRNKKLTLNPELKRTKEKRNQKLKRTKQQKKSETKKNKTEIRNMSWKNTDHLEFFALKVVSHSTDYVHLQFNNAIFLFRRWVVLVHTQIQWVTNESHW